MDTRRFASFGLPEPRVDELPAQGFGREVLPMQFRRLPAGQGGAEVGMAFADRGRHGWTHRRGQCVVRPPPPVA